LESIFKFLRPLKLHAIFSTIYSCQVDIVLTKNNIHALVEAVIINSTQANLFLRSCPTLKFGAFGAAQAKETSYCNQHPIGKPF